jgi:dimethylargininase
MRRIARARISARTTLQWHREMYVALTRAVPPSFVHCELTHVERAPIDVRIATEQHARYEYTLRSLGCRVERIAATPELPDSVFVEDAAVVFDEIAVITRPGAESRRPEIETVAAALAPHRRLHSIDAPGTIDGGDVLQIGRRVYVGISQRTNAEGVRQLADALGPYGYTVTGLAVERCLHLKSAVTVAADDLLVLNPTWIDGQRFEGSKWIDVHPDEPFAANVVRVGDTVICAEGAPRTRDRLERAGLRVVTTPTSELAKAEGALTCCSLIFAER